jgi:molecular chaperone IbpA
MAKRHRFLYLAEKENTMTNYKFNTENFGIPTGLAKQFIGFDQILDRIREASETLPKIPSYPPYNIKKVDDEHYIIEMAVAGFGKQNLDIELKDGELTITGSSEGDGGDYIYQGIANRAFTRKFTLEDTVVVKNAELVNGLLKIALERYIPEEKKAKKIDIMDPFGVGEATKQFLTESGKTWADAAQKVMDAVTPK